MSLLLRRERAHESGCARVVDLFDYRTYGLDLRLGPRRGPLCGAQVLDKENRELGRGVPAEVCRHEVSGDGLVHSPLEVEPPPRVLVDRFLREKRLTVIKRYNPASVGRVATHDGTPLRDARRN